MAKKRFTDDLFGLFEDQHPEQESAVPAGEAAATGDDVPTEEVEVKVSTPTPRSRKKLSSKGFTADLDAFLSDSFAQEAASASAAAPSGAEKKTSPAPAAPPPSRSRRRRKTGLDLLIQSTVADEDRSPRGGKSPDTKRVTLIFNKEHLAQLKQQAKEQGVYLKDVVQQMVSDYLER